MGVQMRKGESTDAVAIRHLDEIQEEEPGPRGGRVAAMVMASFGGACIVFAAFALMRSPEIDEAETDDPLGALVAASEANAEEMERGREEIDTDDVTFPGVLTNQDDPTTAMEAVRRSHDDDPLPSGEELGFAGPPPATDTLPVVPLPAQSMIDAVPRANVSPADTLTQAAQEAARESEKGDGKMAEAGGPGGYQLQVSSFKKPEDAEAFALALRRRGHRAYVVAAHVKGRGLWHRVRIGPFKYRRSAQIYRQDFEAKERIVTFVVDKPKTKVEIAPAN